MIISLAILVNLLILYIINRVALYHIGFLYYDNVNILILTKIL